MKKIVSLLMVTLALILMLGACSKTASNGKDYQYYTAEETKSFRRRQRLAIRRYSS